MIDTKQISESNVLTQNKKAMDKLRDCDYTEAFSHLKEAENILKQLPDCDQL